MKYDVGDVLFLLSRKNNKIVPSRVDSIITVKKINGEEVTHELSVPGVDRTTVLEKLDVIPFSSVSDLRGYMLDFLEKKIDSEIATVIEAASAHWPDSEKSSTTLVDSQKKIEKFEMPNSVQETMEVDLPGGGKARVHLPKELV